MFDLCKNIFLLFLINCSVLFSQKIQLEKIIQLDFNPFRFSINENQKTIFFIDQESNEIIKTDFEGSVIKRIGGFGWGDEQFDLPSDIISTPIEVFVADFNNHAIKRYDFNLNFISSVLQTPQVSFEFPLSIALSNTGELFILDSKRKSVLRINRFNHIDEFVGNYQRGNVFFESPKRIHVDANLNLYILDVDFLFVFDRFGNLLRNIRLDDKVIDFFPVDNELYLLTKDKIFKISETQIVEFYLKEFFSEEVELKQIEIKFGKIFLLAANYLFVLTMTK